MTKRERYLKALRNQPVDALVWAPNFDYWLSVNTAEGTLPPKYAGMSRNDIVRAMGGYIWNRASGVKRCLDPSVREVWRDEGEARIHEYSTPVGSVREVHLPTEGPHRTRFISEHFIKDLESLRVMMYVAEATHYEPNYGPTLKALEETGEDGVVINPGFPVPFVQFAKDDAGYVNGYYLWTDHRQQVDALIELYFRKFLEGFRILADGPADVVATADNLDGRTVPPPIFKEYAIPFYQEVKKIASARGKILEGHWCGQTESLLPITPGSGMDVVEAIVTYPMAKVTLAEALDMLKGEVVLQGGIPSVLVCPEGGTREDFERYIRETILPLKGREGFILGMSDNVPPNADFTRVERVAELIA